ncbi:hypothetical protein [Pseudalkalibacillus berkeleyi]|uniref:YtxH domain-containing protein n=1 Tax=Pseudalkalibacillus berkeleyi TaxID=1069813 RepID=A0ABS9H149_9BACL|nr:hypothetical protein [Pseudalkalibacillus berkeleyi]MCF6137380.1 hypothetical protein [Pseudalkalibacillus berkeleyi]
MKEDKNNGENRRQKNTINFAIAGGIVGSGIGLLTSSNTRKQIASTVGNSELIKGTGNELRRTVQQIFIDQAMLTIKEAAYNYRNKSDRTVETDNHINAQYQELKDENKALNENLQRIEEKLDALLQSDE